MSEYRPCLRALEAMRRLPCSEEGPVYLVALARLAAIWAWDAITLLPVFCCSVAERSAIDKLAGGKSRSMAFRTGMGIFVGFCDRKYLKNPVNQDLPAPEATCLRDAWSGMYVL